MAFVLLCALAFVAANFVLIDVRLLGFQIETRLAWAVLASAALGFAGGILYGRLGDSERDPELRLGDVVDVASRQPGNEASPGHRSALRDDPWTSL